MRLSRTIIATAILLPGVGATLGAQGGGAPADTAADPIRDMVARLDLEKYKATIKGLTQLGDRRQGTDPHRAAVDWIETRLQSYGGSNSERSRCEYDPAQVAGRGRGDGAADTSAGSRGGGAGAARGVAWSRHEPAGQGGSRIRGIRAWTG